MQVTEPVDRLQKALDERVITPADRRYDQARQLFSGAFDGHPAAIVRPADATEVALVVALAREAGLELAVRSGGHSGAGHSTTDGGVVVDLALMKGLTLDVDHRTAWADAGLTAGEFTAAAAGHGLATAFGDTGSVGLGGLTLGGGIGYLVRRHGLTIDSLLAAEVVTATGELLRVDADHYSDLFWALRGGGGNFGVATRFQFRLHELPSVVGGMLVLPATAEVIEGFIAAAEAAPDELSTIANVMSAPPMPLLPPEHHGQLVVMGLMCYAGPADAGERALAPFRALAEPIADLVKPISYAEMFPPDDPDFHPLAVSRNLYADTVDSTTAETILEHLRASDAPIRVAQLRVLGGAAARVPVDATAYAHRDRRLMVNVAAFYGSPEDRAERTAWADRFAAALRQGEPAAYVNFLADDADARVREAYPAPTWDRLREVKARYDPENLFHRNLNIPPADGSAASAGSSAT